MSDPYRSAKAGDAILAESWNQMQGDVRDHIRSHTHTGEKDAGTKLTGASLDKGSTLEVDKVVAATSTITGALTANGATSLNGGLAVTGNGTLSGMLTIAGATSLNGGLTVTGNGTLSGTLTTSGATSLNGGLTVTGNGTMSGMLTVGGTVKVNGSNVIELGADQTKEVNAGKIGYGTFSAGKLCIVGAGPDALSRKVTVWAEGGAEIVGPLSISGNLKIGSNYAVSAPDQSIRIVWGFVNSNAGVESGKGFSVTKEGDGFRINFTTPFAARPCVTATVYREERDNPSTLDNAIAVTISTNTCLLRTGNSLGRPEPRNFSFVAIGY